MNTSDATNILNLAIANGNLQIAICKDDPSEVLKAVHHMEKCQVLCGVSLLNTEQLSGLASMASKRIAERFEWYGVPANA